MAHIERRDRLIARLRSDDLDAMLVSDLNNVRYLSGFTGSNSALLVYADDRPILLVCDNTVFIKCLPAVKPLMQGAQRGCCRAAALRIVRPDNPRFAWLQRLRHQSPAPAARALARLGAAVQLLSCVPGRFFPGRVFFSPPKLVCPP